MKVTIKKHRWKPETADTTSTEKIDTDAVSNVSDNTATKDESGLSQKRINDSKPVIKDSTTSEPAIIPDTAPANDDATTTNNGPVEQAQQTTAEKEQPHEEQEVAKSYTRPLNDPRLQPKPVTQVTVSNVEYDVKMSRALDTSQPAAIERTPRSINRPANDPRKKNSEIELETENVDVTAGDQ